MKTNIENRLLDIKEICGLLSIKPQTVYNQLASGTFPIPTRKVGRMLRWHQQDVNHYLESLPVIN
jgi:excisionase family DNA binding protein